MVLSSIGVRFKLDKDEQNKQISFAFYWTIVDGGTHKSCNDWNYMRWHRYVKIKLVKGYLTSSNLTIPFVITLIDLGCPCDVMLVIVLQIHLVYVLNVDILSILLIAYWDKINGYVNDLNAFQFNCWFHNQI